MSRSQRVFQAVALMGAIALAVTAVACMSGCAGAMGENAVNAAVAAEAGQVHTPNGLMSVSSTAVGGGSSRAAERAQKSANFFGGAR